MPHRETQPIDLFKICGGAPQAAEERQDTGQYSQHMRRCIKTANLQAGMSVGLAKWQDAVELQVHREQSEPRLRGAC